jgi:hypothetical protein
VNLLPEEISEEGEHRRQEKMETPGTTTEVSVNLFLKKISWEAERRRQEKMARSKKKYQHSPQG